MGISYSEFWTMSPKRFHLIREGYLKQMAEEQRNSADISAWAMGYYVVNAISATFGKGKYPSKPDLLMASQSEDEAEVSIEVGAKRDAERIKEMFAAINAKSNKPMWIPPEKRGDLNG